MTASAPSAHALNALTAAATGRRACEHCGEAFEPRRKWARFCATACRRAQFGDELRRRIIHEYLSGLGRKGAAARKARKAVA